MVLVLAKVSSAVINTITKSSLGRKGLRSAYVSQSHWGIIEEKSGQELKAEPGGRNCRNHRRIQHTGLLFMACSVCFLGVFLSLVIELTFNV